jgi:hypothetical protein
MFLVVRVVVPRVALPATERNSLSRRGALMAKPGEQILDLIFQALDHAIQSITNTNGPLIPFAIIETAKGERTLARFATGHNPEEARQQARTHVANNKDWLQYAIAADGILTENNQRIPTIIVEAGRRGDEHGFVFAQRFTAAPNARFGQILRNPGIIGQPPILGSPAAG